MQRSLLDQNEPLLHAEPFLSDQQCRSLLASAIRPVRHNAPLQLSCRCKAQEPSLIDSWRADSESLSMAPARNYPMCENVREENAQNCFLPFPPSTTTASAVLFLFNVIETTFLRASSTSKYSHRLDPTPTW